MTPEMKAQMDALLRGDEAAYKALSVANRVMPLEKAEGLLAYGASQLSLLTKTHPVIAQWLLDMGALADRAAGYYYSQDAMEEARHWGKQSVAFWERAIADYKSAEAQYALGRWYLRVWRVSEPNAEKGLGYVKVAAAQGNGDALYYLVSVSN